MKVQGVVIAWWPTATSSPGRFEPHVYVAILPSAKVKVHIAEEDLSLLFKEVSLLNLLPPTQPAMHHPMQAISKLFPNKFFSESNSSWQPNVQDILCMIWFCTAVFQLVGSDSKLRGIHVEEKREKMWKWKGARVKRVWWNDSYADFCKSWQAWENIGKVARGKIGKRKWADGKQWHLRRKRKRKS